MAVDLSKLKVSNKPFTHLQTSIGNLYLFEVRVKEVMGIEKQLDSKLKELESEKFFRQYLPFFAYLKEDLVGEELERPEEYTLTNDEVAKLSKDELEEIAKLFIEKHSSFYKEWKSSSSKKEDGTPVISLKEEIDESLLKHDDESYIDYVYRLVLERHKRDQERAKKMFSSFSSGLSDDILKNMGIGDSLKNSFDSLKSVSEMARSFSPKVSSFESVKYEPPKLDYDIGQQIRDQEKRRLAPFEKLSSKMDQMIDAEGKTVSLMTDMYKTQVEMASEMKSSSDSANENSKLNIKLTRLVIWLTAIAVLVSLAAFIFTVWFDSSSKQLVKANKDIKSTIIETNSKLEKLTEVLIEQNKMQGEQIKVLREDIKSIQSSAVVVGRNLVSDQNSSNQ